MGTCAASSVATMRGASVLFSDGTNTGARPHALHNRLDDVRPGHAPIGIGSRLHLDGVAEQDTVHFSGF